MTGDPTKGSGAAIGVLVHDFQLGGAERVAIRLANSWSRRVKRVILFSGGGEGLQRKLVDDAVEIVAADPPVVRGMGDSPVKLGKWAAAQAAARGVHLLYLPGNSYFRAVGPLAAVGADIYVTITNSLWRVDRSLMRNLAFAAITRWRLRSAAGVISMSPALLRLERRILGKSPAIEALPNALFDGLPAVPVTAGKPWQICAVGRLVPQKNLALLLRSIALLRDLPVKLSVAGDGPQRMYLEQLSETLGIADRVVFLGAVASAAECMADAEVMVLSSDYEGYPAVVVEALAVGTFVIAGRCSAAMADILRTPEMGTIVEAQRPAGFAKALREFFSGPHRHARAMRLAVARPLVQSHVADEAARGYLDFMGL